MLCSVVRHQPAVEVIHASEVFQTVITRKSDTCLCPTLLASLSTNDKVAHNNIPKHLLQCSAALYFHVSVYPPECLGAKKPARISDLLRSWDSPPTPPPLFAGNAA